MTRLTPPGGGKEGEGAKEPSPPPPPPVEPHVLCNPMSCPEESLAAADAARQHPGRRRHSPPTNGVTTAARASVAVLRSPTGPSCGRSPSIVSSRLLEPPYPWEVDAVAADVKGGVLVVTGEGDQRECLIIWPELSSAYCSLGQRDRSETTIPSRTSLEPLLSCLSARVSPLRKGAISLNQTTTRAAAPP